MDRYRFIGYIESFLGFLFSDQKLWKNEIVKQIILFGSVARGEATESSDIDLFIEVNNTKKSDFVKERLGHALAEFIASRLAKEWALRGIKNEIKVQIGTLSKMSDLKRSLVSDGIVLYGKYSSGIEAEHYLLMNFESIKEKSRRYRIDRYLFGRHEAGISTKGVVEQLGGRRISTRVFSLPVKEAVEVVKKLRSEKVGFSMHEIWSDTL